MSKVVVVAKLRVKDEYLDEVYEELVKLHKATHTNDEGCIQYDLHQNNEDKNSFTFVETWENQELLSQHEKKEHFLSCVGKIDNMIESISIEKLTKLDI